MHLNLEDIKEERVVGSKAMEEAMLVMEDRWSVIIVVKHDTWLDSIFSHTHCEHSIIVHNMR